MKSPRWAILAGTALLFGLIGGLIPAIAGAQETSAPASAPTPTPESTSASEKPKKEKYSHANDFLIIGTIFDPKGYAFPGVELKIRRSTEKKFRWNDYTNSRGEFAVRVPQGTVYEMVVHIKKFADQTREVNAKSGLGEARIVFQMEPEGEKKK
jgi:hypothetical protein